MESRPPTNVLTLFHHRLWFASNNVQDEGRWRNIMGLAQTGFTTCEVESSTLDESA